MVRYQAKLFKKWSFYDNGKDSIRKEIWELSMCKENGLNPSFDRASPLL
jgi:hypothetical protein